MTRVEGRIFVAALSFLWVSCASALPAVQQMPAPPLLKGSLTPAQTKLDTHLLTEIFRKQGTAEKRGLPPGPTGVKVDKDDRAYVDIRAEVTPALIKKVEDAGSKVISTSERYRSIVAWVPVLRLEALAADSAIYSIIPTPEPVIKHGQ